ncbi:FAD-linked oxidoreductase ZEB1 [Lachnellula arida]|uniref:FAD-linked oxidoreductase ZEB1 n=1 Tax=Lachnellula arida TaxID=1316785 RepID=A0A8T9BIP1_9HELO|nr:FAD-linked oxidoreductase ZEB1 [Lachnellula arida]
MFFYIIQLLSLTSTVVSVSNLTCKSTPGSKDWPSDAEWAQLNLTLSGRLLKPSPPGAVCHPDQPTFNTEACPVVQAGWNTSIWHTNNPVNSVLNNVNNDTCLPEPTDPCSGEGYPIYVVNATSADDVKKGVDFARENNIRLIVKATGHDYMGRSSAPKSLSIWTHHIKNISFQDGFTPKGCNFSDPIEGAAITIGAGEQMIDIDQQAHLRNLTIVSAGGGTVGPGGYLTGAGHAALSSTYGLGADQVLEMEIVTPGGDIITINECQHTDLFWAVRGGGGSTFGVITSVTIKAFPSSTFLVATVFLGIKIGTEAYWDVATSLLGQFPALGDQGMAAYSEFVYNYTSADLNITTPVDGFSGTFILPALHPENTTESLTATLRKVLDDVTAPYPNQFMSSISSQSYLDFYTWYLPSSGPNNAGFDAQTGSRLLDGKALTNASGLEEALKLLIPAQSPLQIYLVSGKGVHNAQPRGGGNAVNPAWRSAYVHTVVGAYWEPFDLAEKAKQEDLLTNTYVEAWRKLAPDTGAYVNEADVNEPNFQQAFWGDHYPRLLSIKKAVDLTDVFWCHPCVGNEGWKVIDDVLCRV